MLSVDVFSRGQMRLAAGLCPNLLGELQRSPTPHTHNGGRGPTSKGKETAGEKEGEGIASSLFNFWLRA